MAAPPVFGRYRVIEILGSGGSGSHGRVLKVEDLHTHEDRVLKVILDDAATFPLFEHLDLWLGVDHPHVARIWDAGQDATGISFYCGTLLPGAPVDRVHLDTLPVAEGLTCLRQALEGLRALHERGLIHGNLKPTNVFVDEGDGLHLWLADGGMPAAPPGGVLAGDALVWSAPECVDGASPGIRADLYAIGAIFYAALTGFPPFRAAGWEALRAQKRGGIVAPPSALRAELPPDVDALLGALMATDPTTRPASADAALRLLASIVPTAGAADDLDALTPLALVGRDKTLTTVDRALEGVRGGRGRLLLLAGGAGSGKTRLLQEIQLRLHKAGLSPHAVRCPGPAAPTETLTRLLSGPLTHEGERWQEAIRRHAAALKPFFPALFPPPGPPRPLGTRDWRGRGTSHALALADDLASLLLEVSAEPRVLLIDDIHLGAAGVQRLLAQLVLRLESAPLLIVATLDPAGLPEDAPLAAVAGEAAVTRVELTDLSRAHVESLLTQALPETKGLERLAEEIDRWAGGNPGRIEQALAAAVSTEVLVHAHDGWKVFHRHLSRLADRLGTRSRLGPLALFDVDDRDRDLLRAMAVLEPMSTAMVPAVLGGSAGDAEARLAQLARRGWVLKEEDPPVWRLARPSQRAALAAEVDRADRRAWHRRLADHLASAGRGTAPPERLALHWMEAGEDLKALAPGLEAIDRLTGQWRFEEALGWAKAFLGLQGLDEVSTFRLRERALDLALVLGDLDEARTLAEPLNDAGPGALPALLQWRVEWALARLCLRTGAYEEARGRLESATSWAPEGAPAAERFELSTAYVLARMLTGRADVAERLAASALEGAADPADPDTARCSLQLWSLRTNLAWNRGATDEVESFAIQGFRMAEAFGRRFPEDAAAIRPELAQLSLLRANACYQQGRYGDTLQSAAEALSRFAEVGDLLFMARCHDLLGLANVAAGELRQALVHFESLRELSRRAWSPSDLCLAARQLGTLYRITGRLDLAEAALEEGLAAAQELQDRRTLGLLHSGLGEVWHRRGDFDRARRSYELAVESLKYASRADLLESLWRILELTFDENKLHGFEMKVAEALTLARSQNRPAAEGNLLALLGTYTARMGRTREAMGHFRAGEAVLRTAGAHYDLGRLKLRQGRVYVDVGATAEAEGALRAAEETFRRLGAEPELRVAAEALKLLEETSQGHAQIQRKLELLLEVNKSLNTVLDVEQLLDTIVDRAIELTHSERGFVVLFDTDGRPTLHTSRHMQRKEVAGQADQISSTVIERVRRTLAPVTVTNVDRDSELRSSRSVVSLGLSAILAAPLKRGERLLGVLYLDSSRPVEDFYRRDQSLLEALADAAAIAVENAQLVTSLRRKTELMSILAHEFRNPVTATLLFVRQLLRRADPLPPEDREALEIIAQQGDRLGRMIANILELSKMEADKVDWAFEPVSLAAVLDTSVKGIRPLAAEKELRVDIHLPPGLWTWGSEDRLIQVCTNLLANAIRYSEPRGAVWFEAELVPRPEAPADREGRDHWRAERLPPGTSLDGSQDILVSLHDEGSGVPDAELSHIFEPFAQSGPASRRGKGTGLGLSISKDIVVRHGGRIWAENRPGGGAVFRFTVPLLRRAGVTPTLGPLPTP